MGLDDLVVRIKNCLFGKGEPSVQEFLEDMRKRYHEKVKPLIESEEYSAAGSEMWEIYMHCKSRYKEIALEIHSGLNYLIATKLLTDSLKDAREKPYFDIEWFEMTQAQTKLPNTEQNF